MIQARNPPSVRIAAFPPVTREEHLSRANIIREFWLFRSDAQKNRGNQETAVPGKDDCGGKLRVLVPSLVSLRR